MNFSYDYSSWHHFYNLWQEIITEILYLDHTHAANEVSNVLNGWLRNCDMSGNKLSEQVPIVEEMSIILDEVLVEDA